MLLTFNCIDVKWNKNSTTNPNSLFEYEKVSEEHREQQLVRKPSKKTNKQKIVENHTVFINYNKTQVIIKNIKGHENSQKLISE